MADKPPSGAPPPYGGSPYPPQPAHLNPGQDGGGSNQAYYGSPSPQPQYSNPQVQYGSPQPQYGAPAQGYYQSGPPRQMGYQQQGPPMGYQQGPPMGYQQYPQQDERGHSSGAAGGCLGALCAAMACCCCLDILF
ncbi:hypothetical protein VE02_04893 [Pseudogymnoascus sp. 03VT05]|nr:hypothetical protein VE02_04893 [Pseudogymnoascus sp. 03VT05]